MLCNERERVSRLCILSSGEELRVSESKNSILPIVIDHYIKSD